MLIKPMTDAQLVDAYGVKYQQIYPAGGDYLADWGVGRAVVKPLGCTGAHQHLENELFLITSGDGEMVIGPERSPIAAGQYVLIPAGEEHQLRNASSEQALEFLSVYWPPRLGALGL